MKKILTLLLCISLVSAVSSCGGDTSSGRAVSGPTDVNDVIQARMAEEGGSTPSSDAYAAPAGTGPAAGDPLVIPQGEEGVDYDLTVMSSSLVYSIVYSMVTTPQDYIGLTVKMQGTYASYHDEVNDKYYFACIIADATACCSQGIEFELTDDYTYPDDYPEEGSEICVTGVFDVYQEGGTSYCTLRDATLS
ncbi:MAG: hypothetical protein K6F79_00575 [Saccharofermentans sp.]|nr:hypothetical protein [Saccharofermentans sp.]